MRTSIILIAVMAAVLGGTLIASAQVSSGSTEAAQQNFAKKTTTDKPGQNDQQNATTNTDKPGQNDQQNATTSRRQEAPAQEAPKSGRQ
jgi:hypothetical protein